MGKLKDYITDYADIVAYSGNGGIIHSYDDDFKHYIDRKVIHFWIDCIVRRAYIQIA